MSRNQPTKFVRGGQTTQHWWRMATQVLRTSLFMALGAFAATYVALVLLNYEIRYMRGTFATWMAEYNVTLDNPHKMLRYVDEHDRAQNRTAAEIHADPQMRKRAQVYRENAALYAWYSVIPAAIFFFASAGIFFLAGQKLGENEHVRGSRLISQEDLVRWSQQKWRTYRKKFGKDAKKAPPYTIAGIPFPPNAVEAQTGIFGTVGVGKTNAIKELLGTIRTQNGRAIVYDKMGALVRDFYDPATDIIINPFDARSGVWSPFYEARTPEALAQIAEVMIQSRPGQEDPFWSQTARLVFEYTARALLRLKNPTNADLRRAIMTVSAAELENLIAGTPGQHFFGQHIEKTSASIRANMIAELRFLEFLRDDGIPFSIRDWVKADKPGFIFLTGDAEHAAATRNIISTIVEVAANALMTCEEKRDPSLWFFLDEVPTLNRLPFLVSKLAEIRQFGGAFVLGYQVYSQLEDIYGDKGAQSIAGTINNRVVFNTPDARTAKIFSESLGFEDLLEQRENLSFGAHESRDGVSFIAQRVERPIVTASEIQALPQFRAYIRFAYDAPTAQVKFEPVVTEPRAEKLVPYQGGGFDLDGMDPNTTPAPSPAPPSVPETVAPALLGEVKAEQQRQFSAWPADRQIAAFEAWCAEAGRQDYNLDTSRFERQLEETDRAILWDHYYRERARGIDRPVFRLSPDTEALASNRPKGGTAGDPAAVQVPAYSDVMAAARAVGGEATPSTEQERPSNVIPLAAAPPCDPLADAMDDGGSLL